jgi:hypothetical protein
MATRFRLFVVACAVGLALPQLVGAAVPNGVATHLLGARMIRAEVVVKSDGLRDYRLDRGRVTAITGGANRSLTLSERDGTVVTVPVAPGADVKLNGVPTALTALRPRMTATTIRDNNGAATTVIATRT